jgi:phenylpropionate dioxygenase-like ring-hydroxylating dioxygenase large terminal subunit
MMLSLEESERLVSIDRGEIDRRIFCEPEIFEQEMVEIFGRAWLFLCHETQIPKSGDFFESVMGRDHVLVVRQKDGSLKGLLNSCAHRGNAVCRAEEGNARSFLCTYHGWSYGIDGRLQGVPGHKAFYRGELDKSAHGLREIAQLDSYRGFVFGTHDRSAPPLQAYLGATGRLGIDLLAGRGELEIIPGVQKFVIDCNWKFALDNLFDWYHPQVTHASAFNPEVLRPPKESERPPPPAAKFIDMGAVRTQDGEEIKVPISEITGTDFDQVVLLGEYGHAIGGPDIRGRSDLLATSDERWRASASAQSALGPVGIHVNGHPSLFPSAWITTTMQLSLRIPRGPNKTEIWWFSFVDRNASADERRRTLRRASLLFGPGGLLEQDDGENWAQSTMTTTGLANRRLPQLLNMGLGHGEVKKEHGLARIEGTTNEHGQLWTYHAWAQWMRGLSWPELREATSPGDRL